MNQFAESDSQRIVERTVDANGHEVIVVLKTRPANGLLLDDVHLEPNAGGYLDRRAGDFTVAHGAVRIPEEQQCAGNAHRQVESIARARLRGIHVAAELRRYD